MVHGVTTEQNDPAADQKGQAEDQLQTGILY